MWLPVGDFVNFSDRSLKKCTVCIPAIVLAVVIWFARRAASSWYSFVVEKQHLSNGILVEANSNSCSGVVMWLSDALCRLALAELIYCSTHPIARPLPVR